MRWFLIAGFIVLSACSRPLTPHEERFAQDVFGETLDTSAVRISRGLGFTPPSKLAPEEVQVFSPHPEACLRVPRPASDRPPPQAFALWNRMHFGGELYSGEMAAPWPYALRFPNAMILAHELTHVWQWQNREITGYTPFRAATESWTSGDPYFWETGERPVFLSFGFEQQASIVEDYLCFTFANPNHPQRAELQKLLAPLFPVVNIDLPMSAPTQ